MFHQCKKSASPSILTYLSGCAERNCCVLRAISLLLCTFHVQFRLDFIPLCVYRKSRRILDKDFKHLTLWLSGNFLNFSSSYFSSRCRVHKVNVLRPFCERIARLHLPASDRRPSLIRSVCEGTSNNFCVSAIFPSRQTEILFKQIDDVGSCVDIQSSI